MISPTYEFKTLYSERINAKGIENEPLLTHFMAVRIKIKSEEIKIKLSLKLLEVTSVNNMRFCCVTKNLTKSVERVNYRR